MPRTRVLSRSGIAIAAAVWSLPSAAQPARASGVTLAGSPSAQDGATAQALFDDAKRLMAGGQFAEACPKLEESQRLDPGAGTVLALALCFEGQGRTSTAWALFNQASSDARRDRRPDRESVAAEHLRALERRLTRVRVNVASSTEGIEVRRDGALVGKAQWGTALPVDPGEYRFEARAPGKKTWSSVVATRGEGAVVDVAVPGLLDDDAPPQVAQREVITPPSNPRGVAADAPRAAAAEGESDSADSQRTWAFVAGGVGLVASGVGVAFGVSAVSKWDEARTACPNGVCAQEASLALGDGARRAADISTGFFVVGAAGLATATVLFVTASSANGAPNTGGARIVPVMSAQGAGLVLRGSL